MAPDEIQRSLGRIEGAIAGLHKDVKEGREYEQKTDARVSSLELWRALLTGGWIVGMAILVFILKR